MRFVPSILNSPNGFFQKMVNLESRSFSLQLQKFDNGYFISLAEGSNKIGSMVASLATGPIPVTTTVIPSRSESLFLKLVAERISTRIQGIVLISAFFQKELETNVAKALMSEIMETIDND